MSNPPFISPVFQIVGNILQYKPHVDFATWIPVWDLTGLIPAPISYPNCAYIMPQMFSGTHFSAPTAQAGQWENSFSTLSGTNAVAECEILLGPGNYNIAIGYAKSAGSGRLAVKLDGVLFPSTRIDFYNAATLLSQYSDVALATGVSAGMHTLRLEMDGRNVSSSGFNLLMSFIAIREV